MTCVAYPVLAKSVVCLANAYIPSKFLFLFFNFEDIRRGVRSDVIDKASGSIFPVAEPKYMLNCIRVRGRDNFQFSNKFLRDDREIFHWFWFPKIPSLKHNKYFLWNLMHIFLIRVILKFYSWGSSIIVVIQFILMGSFSLFFFHKVMVKVGSNSKFEGKTKRIFKRWWDNLTKTDVMTFRLNSFICLGTVCCVSLNN